MKRQPGDTAVVSSDHSLRQSVRRIPQAHKPRLITRRHDGAVGAHGGPCHTRRVALQNKQRLAIFHIPHTGRLVPARRDRPQTVRTDDDIADRPLVSRPLSQRVRPRHIPHPNDVVLPTGEHKLTVGTRHQAMHLPLRSRQRADFRAGDRIPKSNRRVGSRGHHVPAVAAVARRIHRRLMSGHPDRGRHRHRRREGDRRLSLDRHCRHPNDAHDQERSKHDRPQRSRSSRSSQGRSVLHGGIQHVAGIIAKKASGTQKKVTDQHTCIRI